MNSLTYYKNVMNPVYQSELEEMKTTSRSAILKTITHKFDFEIGYLIKSPCRECFDQKKLPGCLNDCELLDRIQSILSQAVSCTKAI